MVEPQPDPEESSPTEPTDHIVPISPTRLLRLLNMRTTLPKDDLLSLYLSSKRAYTLAKAFNDERLRLDHPEKAHDDSKEEENTIDAEPTRSSAPAQNGKESSGVFFRPKEVVEEAPRSFLNPLGGMLTNRSHSATFGPLPQQLSPLVVPPVPMAPESNKPSTAIEEPTKTHVSQNNQVHRFEVADPAKSWYKKPTEGHYDKVSTSKLLQLAEHRRHSTESSHLRYDLLKVLGDEDSQQVGSAVQASTTEAQSVMKPSLAAKPGPSALTPVTRSSPETSATEYPSNILAKLTTRTSTPTSRSLPLLVPARRFGKPSPKQPAVQKQQPTLSGRHGPFTDNYDSLGVLELRKLARKRKIITTHEWKTKIPKMAEIIVRLRQDDAARVSGTNKFVDNEVPDDEMQDVLVDGGDEAVHEIQDCPVGAEEMQLEDQYTHMYVDMVQKLARERNLSTSGLENWEIKALLREDDTARASGQNRMTNDVAAGEEMEDVLETVGNGSGQVDSSKLLEHGPEEGDSNEEAQVVDQYTDLPMKKTRILAGRRKIRVQGLKNWQIKARLRAYDVNPNAFVKTVVEEAIRDHFTDMGSVKIREEAKARGIRIEGHKKDALKALVRNYEAKKASAMASSNHAATESDPLAPNLPAAETVASEVFDMDVDTEAFPTARNAYEDERNDSLEHDCDTTEQPAIDTEAQKEGDRYDAMSKDQLVAEAKKRYITYDRVPPHQLRTKLRKDDKLDAVEKSKKVSKPLKYQASLSYKGISSSEAIRRLAQDRGISCYKTRKGKQYHLKKNELIKELLEDDKRNPAENVEEMEDAGRGCGDEDMADGDGVEYDSDKGANFEDLDAALNV